MNITPLFIQFLSISFLHPDFLSKNSKIEPMCSLTCIFPYKGSKRHNSIQSENVPIKKHSNTSSILPNIV